MEDTKKIILRVLKDINYSGDTKEFAKQFIKNIELQSLFDLISSLSADKQKEIKTRLAATANDRDKTEPIINTYFTQAQLSNSLMASAKKSIISYFEAINPTLSASQRQRLGVTLNEVASNSSL